MILEAAGLCLPAQRVFLRQIVSSRSDRVLASSEGFGLADGGLSAAELGARIENEMVGWDGIEPPTPGFSDLGLYACKYA